MCLSGKGEARLPIGSLPWHGDALLAGWLMAWCTVPWDLTSELAGKIEASGFKQQRHTPLQNHANKIDQTRTRT
jgi:hypothetical protein